MKGPVIGKKKTEGRGEQKQQVIKGTAKIKKNENDHVTPVNDPLVGSAFVPFAVLPLLGRPTKKGTQRSQTPPKPSCHFGIAEDPSFEVAPFAMFF